MSLESIYSKLFFFIFYLSLFFLSFWFKSQPLHCSGLIPGTELRVHSWWCSRNHIECQGWNPGWSLAGQEPYPLYYLSVQTLPFSVFSVLLPKQSCPQTNLKYITPMFKWLLSKYRVTSQLLNFIHRVLLNLIFKNFSLENGLVNWDLVNESDLARH